MPILDFLRFVFVRLPRPVATVRDARLHTRLQEEQDRRVRQRRPHQSGVTAFDNPAIAGRAERVHVVSRRTRIASDGDLAGFPSDGIEIEHRQRIRGRELARQRRLARSGVADQCDAHSRFRTR